MVVHKNIVYTDLGAGLHNFETRKKAVKQLRKIKGMYWGETSIGIPVGRGTKGYIIVMNTLHFLNAGGIHIDLIAERADALSQLELEVKEACLPLQTYRFKKEEKTTYPQNTTSTQEYAQMLSQQRDHEERTYWEQL